MLENPKTYLRVNSLCSKPNLLDYTHVQANREDYPATK